MKLRKLLESLLMTSSVLSFMIGAALMTLAIYLFDNVGTLVEGYIDPVVKRSNLTRTLVARYGSIVPNKDYIPTEVDVGPWVTWIPIRIFDMGVVIVVFSAFTGYALQSRKTVNLYIVIGLLSAAVVGQFIFMVNLMDVRSGLHTKMRRELLQTLRARYEFGAETHDPFSLLFNAVMLMGECCGISDAHDFTRSKHHFIHTTGNSYNSRYDSSTGTTHNATVLFPLACCQRYYIEAGFIKTLDCALSWSVEAVNRRGCYQTAHSYITEQFGSAILWIYLTVSYIEVLQVFLTLCLVRHLRQGNVGSLACVRQTRLRDEGDKAPAAETMETDV